jgi:Domain of unknown function (DUF6438)
MIRTTILVPALIAVLFSHSQAQTSGPVITLERTTEAFGVLPAYEISIHADRTVIYRAIPHQTSPAFRAKPIKRQTAKGSISQAELQQLLSEFERVNYFSLKDNYGMSGDFANRTKDCLEMWTDHTSAYTSLTMNGKTKKVAHYHGCKGNEAAEKLTWLEDRIDQVVNSKQWIE